jgi:thiamine-monophosphate kinase
MKLKDLGEFNLIRQIASDLPSLKEGIVGIGDDCAVIPKSGSDEAWLISTDMLVEGVHFLTSKMSPVQLGAKVLIVNLSDIAAMGGSPRFCFLSMALPSDLEVSWIEDFFKGFRNICSLYDVLLLGGDTTHSLNGITLSVTIIGDAKITDIKKRSTAMPGDLIAVTATLGDSAAGLECLLKKNPSFDYLLNQHLAPKPYLAEGRFLAKEQSVHSMMDVSDGLASDLLRITESSNCKARIDLEKIPLSRELILFSEKEKVDPIEYAVCGGEDYCLIFTFEKRQLAELIASYSEKFRKPFYVIGEVLASDPTDTTMSRLKILYAEHGRVVSGERTEKFRGYDHFAKN